MPEDEPLMKSSPHPLAEPAPPAPDAATPTPPSIAVDDEATRIMPAPAEVSVGQPLVRTANSETNPPTRPRTPGADSGHTHRDSGLPGADEAVSHTLPGGAESGAPESQRVGRYIVQERLGRGGMATVFKAHDPQIDRAVALKFLHASLCADDEYRSRFLREARAAGGLSHPNIVTVYDVGEIEGRPYMAMELLDGAPLADEMAAGAAIPVREVVVVGIQLARALAYAHSRGIVHRDIKPGNLMRVKGTQTIKVTDFGIAHMESVGGEHRTRVGDILGTPQYMSPEQAQGVRLDGRSDLFATGILLYQMLTGQRPFLGDTLVALAVQIVKDDPVPIETLRPGLPGALRRVVERCLAKLPERRFQTGEELAQALERVLADIDEAQRSQGKPRIVPLRVKWAATMAVIVAAVMGLTATIVTRRQHAAMEEQVVQSGAAMARFIAAQDAVAALAEDWVAVEVALQETMKTGDFQSITVIDRDGIVRASSQADRVGQAYAAPAGKPVAAVEGGVPVTRYKAGGQAVLGFEAPITFQSKRVGGVALGLHEQPLLQVVRLSIALMVLLVVVTVLAVAIAMYFVANWFARPIKQLEEAMGELALGRFEHRIREKRHDEFGELYAAFDRMAQALQARQSPTVVGSGAPAGEPAAACEPAADDRSPERDLAVGTGDGPRDRGSDTTPDRVTARVDEPAGGGLQSARRGTSGTPARSE